MLRNLLGWQLPLRAPTPCTPPQLWPQPHAQFGNSHQRYELGELSPSPSAYSKPTPGWVRDHPQSTKWEMRPTAPPDTSCPPTGPAVVPASLRVGLRARGLRHREGPARLCRKRDKQQVPDLEKQNLAGVHLRDRDTLLGGSISLGAQHGDEGADPLRWGGHGTPWAGSSQEGARGERGDIQVYFLQKNKLPPSSTPPQPSRPQGR